jgi:hypothetical protein
VTVGCGVSKTALVASADERHMYAHGICSSAARWPQEQDFAVPQQAARYWRLEVLATHGGAQAVLRGVQLFGPPPQARGAHSIDFAIVPDGAFHTYYVPVYKTFRYVEVAEYRAGMREPRDNTTRWCDASF